MYEAHVVPRYSSLFGRMLLAQLPRGERLQVLDVGCGTGYPALDVLSRLGDGGRVIAIDPDPARLDVARRRGLGATGRSIFFKADSAEKLSFGDEVFDVAIGNLALGAFQQPDLALAEMRRVLAADGRLLLTHALEGTFEEVFDSFRELALKRDDKALLGRVERMAARTPSAPSLVAMVRSAGFSDVEVTTEEFQLAFGSAAEIFTDPAIRVVALPEWRWCAGFHEGSEHVLDLVQRTLDTYFGGGPLTIRVSAGLVSARA